MESTDAQETEKQSLSQVPASETEVSFETDDPKPADKEDAVQNEPKKKEPKEDVDQKFIDDFNAKATISEEASLKPPTKSLQRELADSNEGIGMFPSLQIS